MQAGEMSISLGSTFLFRQSREQTQAGLPAIFAQNHFVRAYVGDDGLAHSIANRDDAPVDRSRAMRSGDTRSLQHRTRIERRDIGFAAAARRPGWVGEIS